MVKEGHNCEIFPKRGDYMGYDPVLYFLTAQPVLCVLCYHTEHLDMQNYRCLKHSKVTNCHVAVDSVRSIVAETPQDPGLK